MTSYATVNEAPTTTTTTTTAAAAADVVAVVVTPTDSARNSESPLATGVVVVDCASSPPTSIPSKLLQDPLHHADDNDCDSLSDGREKADTTPENIKKIDDLIEQRSSLLSAGDDASHQPYVLMSPSTPPSTASNPSYGIGLAAAVDESNAKFCLARPARPLSPLYHHCEKDSKSERQITPLIQPAESISNNNDSNSSSHSADADVNNDAAADDDSSASNTTTTTGTATATANKSYAFTIDNFNERDSDPAAAAAAATKYKNMLERFQNRHRRGASMSKLENNSSSAQTTPTLTASASASPLTLRNARNAYRNAEGNAGAAEDTSSSAAPKVKLRTPRDRSNSRVRDASKRHSWSPRSNTQEQAAATYAATQNERQKTATQTTKAQPTARKPAAPPVPPPKNKALPKGAANLLANRTSSAGATTQFTPRSTAMQLALQKIDFLCPQPPLGDFKHLHATASDADNISEAGTYTLDGDNYTEEQKDLMNIDSKNKSRKLQQLQQQQQQQQRPKDLNLHASVSEAVFSSSSASKIPINNRTAASNVLEVNYYHESSTSTAVPLESPPQSPHSSPTLPAARLRPTATVSDFILGQHQSAGAYLEKIKSRVLRNMNATKNTATQPTPPPSDMADCSSAGDGGSDKLKAPTAEEDMGCFTSVTTSGVLAKQSALDPRPRLTRRSSLSTSQIDSSEYISNEAKLKSTTASAYAAGGFTDHQKAEYRLNVFTNQKDMQKFAATRSFIESPPDTPTSSSATGGGGSTKQHNQQIIANMQRSDTAVLKTAQTKNDWIQEWARNARARSLATETTSSNTGTTKQYHRHSGGGGNSSATSKHHQDHHHALPPHHHHHHHHPNQDLMTRSYTCSDTGTGVDSLTDDSIYSARQQSAAAAMRLNRTLAERFRLAGDAACCDYSSDPALCTSYAKRAAADDVAGNCKPPKSPSKIPSPLHSLGRARSASRTRASLQNMLPLDSDENYDGTADESANIYLQKTAAVIQSLQQSLSRKNSLNSPSTGSPRAHSVRAAPPPPLLYSPGDCSPQQSLESPTSVGGGGSYQLPHHHHHHHQRSPLHRRNHSNDAGYSAAARAAREQLALMTSSINEQQLQLLTSGEYLAKQMRQRKNSFDGSGAHSPAARRQAAGSATAQQQQTLSPLRRSSSFSAKIATTQRAARPQYQNIYTPPAARLNYVAPQRHLPATSIKKSASSNNFRQELYGDYDDHLAYYINDEDDDVVDPDEPYYSSGGELESAPIEADTPTATLSNTRYNKALLMRIERSKQKVAGSNSGGVGGAGGKAPRATSAAAAAGLVACPNTPELPRRNIKSAPRAGAGVNNSRQSVPRDISLSRLATQVPNSLASAKKQLLQTAAAAAPTIKNAGGAATRIQPKYLDISKYKPAQGNNFLRKNDAKSTLKTPVATATGGGADSAMKRSPSATSMGLSRGDPTRASNRSVRSAASCMTTSGTSLGGGGSGLGRTASSVRRDASVAKQKEAEMAMWKRRSKYDPMKAAADDRRKKEEAKRLAQSKNPDDICFESQQNSYEQQQWSPLDETECGGEDDE